MRKFRISLKKVFEFVLLLFLFVFIIGLSSCNTNTPNNGTDNTNTNENTNIDNNEPKQKDIYEELAKVCSSVTKLDHYYSLENDKYKERIKLTFTSYIDWHNKALGTFELNAFLGFVDFDAVTVYVCDGYELYDTLPGYEDYFTWSSRTELTRLYNGNEVEMEYRFFGNSTPVDFDVLGTKYYEYLTSEQASTDFHNVITLLSTVLIGKTIFTGISKGGYTTEAMAYYYPNDIDCFVSYVAPLCNGMFDSRFMENQFNTIGNLAYGEEKAKEYRDILLEFDKFCLRKDLRSYMLDKMDAYITENELLLNNRLSKEELYELVIVDFSTGVWQYYQDFDTLSSYIAMSEETEEDLYKKADAFFDYFKGDISNFDLNSPIQPYTIQAYTEMGNYAYSVASLKENGCYITMSEETANKASLLAYVTEEQERVLSRSNFNLALRNFLDTTTVEIVKIVGLADVWYAVGYTETTNPNIHIFKAPNSHVSDISTLSEEDNLACKAIINRLLGFNN